MKPVTMEETEPSCEKTSAGCQEADREKEENEAARLAVEKFQKRMSTIIKTLTAERNAFRTNKQRGRR